jgi:hypothetical protein
MKKLNLTSKRLIASSGNAPKQSFDGDSAVVNVMLDPRYLRQSSSLVQDALQKGFDVLQLSNGDLVTTGTKTIVNQYSWDDEKGKLVKSKSDARKTKRSSEDSDEMVEDLETASEDISENEEA